MRAWIFVCALVAALALPAVAWAEGEPDPIPMETITTSLSPYDEGRNQGMNMGNWEQAAQLFRKAVAEDPSHYKAFNMLGYSLRQMGKVKEAIAAYNRALAIKPDYAPALEYRGIALLKAGNRRAAMADYEKLVRMGSSLANDLKEELEKDESN